MSRSFSNCGLPVKYNYKKDSDNPTLTVNNEVLTFVRDLEYKEYFYCDGYAMKEFKNSKGELFEEFEQACPWASGPILYLGLRKVKSKEVVLKWNKIPEIDSISDLKELIELCTNWDESKEQFKKIVTLALDPYGHSLAFDFEVVISTVNRWADGVADPFPQVKRLIVDYIKKSAIEDLS
jgi:hypothetical protein